MAIEESIEQAVAEALEKITWRDALNKFHPVPVYIQYAEKVLGLSADTKITVQHLEQAKEFDQKIEKGEKLGWANWFLNRAACYISELTPDEKYALVKYSENAITINAAVLYMPSLTKGQRDDLRDELKKSKV